MTTDPPRIIHNQAREDRMNTKYMQSIVTQILDQLGADPTVLVDSLGWGHRTPKMYKAQVFLTHRILDAVDCIITRGVPDDD